MANPIPRQPSSPDASSTRRATWQRLGRVFGGMLALLLAAALPLQAVSTALADVLGPRHAHRAMSPTGPPSDPMAGWRDFRRVHDDPPAGSAAHALAHAAGERHRHDRFDVSVQMREPATDPEGVTAGAGGATAAFVFVAAVGPMPLALPGQVRGNGWHTVQDVRFRSAAPRRLERPPQRLG